MQAAGRQGWGVGDLGDDGAARGPEPEQLALGGALDEVEDGNVCGRRPARRVGRTRRQQGGDAPRSAQSFVGADGPEITSRFLHRNEHQTR